MDGFEEPVTLENVDDLDVLDDPYGLPSGGDGSCGCGEAVPGGDRGGEGGQIYINLYYIIDNDHILGRTERRCAQT